MRLRHFYLMTGLATLTLGTTLPGFGPDCPRLRIWNRNAFCRVQRLGAVGWQRRGGGGGFRMGLDHSTPR